MQPGVKLHGPTLRLSKYASHASPYGRHFILMDCCLVICSKLTHVNMVT